MLYAQIVGLNSHPKESHLNVAKELKCKCRDMNANVESVRL